MPRVEIHLITPEYPPQPGGVAGYTRMVGRALAEAGEHVHVWAPASSAPAIDGTLRIHPEMGEFRSADLVRAGRLLDEYSSPRRLVVQWVPHAYGFHSMNVAFCLWLWRRAAAGDRVEVMVHEPYLALWEGSWRQTFAAIVHRVMTMILLRAASGVWVSIPAWEPMWKPYTLGRSVPFRWLPIPTSVCRPRSERVNQLHEAFTTSSQLVVGHLGTYGPLVTPMLLDILPGVLAHPSRPALVLIGAGSAALGEALRQRHPEHAASLHATGTVSEEELAEHVAACDLLVQPYPDGISARRTSAMAGLFLETPIVTTKGRLTETLWEQSAAVRLAAVGDRDAFLRAVDAVLSSSELRRQLRDRGRSLYDRTFDLRLTVAALRNVA
jgi:glycosyltransferase involved in cell wall biosynthesis